MAETVVIVGAGHTAVQAVDTLRREGRTGPIVLVGEEPYLPYNRPPLSKKYLAGELERGAGKSTLMKILSGYQPPDSGEIVIDGQPQLLPHRRKRWGGASGCSTRIHWIFQPST